MTISAIPKGTTRAISVAFAGAPDIRNDTVTLTIKSNKDDADPGALQTDADVATGGANGVAVFVLTPSQTSINPGQYFYDIVWRRAADSALFVMDTGSNIITIAERVSDV